MLRETRNSMAYAMIHFIIANEFAKDLEIEDKPIFLLGSIAPDAVHAREDFNLVLKADSHFMQREAKWGEVITEEPMVIWYNHMKEAFEQRIKNAKTQKEQLFLKGYFIHILTDIFNSKLFYGRYLAKYGVENVLSFREKYKTECIKQDNYLYHTYPDSQVVMDSLQKALKEDLSEELLSDLQLNCYLSKDNLTDAAEYQIHMLEASQKGSLDGLQIVTYQRTYDFIEEVKSESERMLFHFPDCERTFRMDE